MPTPSPADSGAAGPPPVTRAQRLSFAVSACVLQFFVMYMTAMMGRGWGGSTYTAATRQSVLAFGAIGIITALTPRPRWALTVPILSAARTALLLLVAGQGTTSGRSWALATADRVPTGVPADRVATGVPASRPISGSEERDEYGYSRHREYFGSVGRWRSVRQFEDE